MSMIDRFEWVADEYEARARSVRSRVSRASPQSQHVMRAEAAAYERVVASLRRSIAEANEQADDAMSADEAYDREAFEQEFLEAEQPWY